jgi:hypothetical protein
VSRNTAIFSSTLSAVAPCDRLRPTRRRTSVRAALEEIFVPGVDVAEEGVD